MDILSNVDDYKQWKKISVSESNSYLRCSQKHDYSYRQGLKPVSAAKYFSLGKFVHALQELIMKHVQEHDFISGQEINQLSRYLQRVGIEGHFVEEKDRAHHTNTIKELWKTDTEYPFAIIHVEQEFYADIGLGYDTLLHGKIDAVVQDLTTSELWIMEHKTASRAWSDGNYTFDRQPSLYAHAYEAITGHSVAGVVYNFFFPPRKTKAKSYDSRAHYFEMGQTQGWVDELKSVVRGINSQLVMRQPHWGCSDCTFKELCYDELTGNELAANETREAKFLIDLEKVERYT